MMFGVLYEYLDLGADFGFFSQRAWARTTPEGSSECLRLVTLTSIADISMLGLVEL